MDVSEVTASVRNRIGNAEWRGISFRELCEALPQFPVNQLTYVTDRLYLSGQMHIRDGRYFLPKNDPDYETYIGVMVEAFGLREVPA